ncbi:MAG TPA: UDP-N-acetylmuramoyl-L-alanyl-D-glutamate--2,6-diaminopimelate ligase [Bauldia sp.]|nr:UDP-N-acetylmuramoyl-L-alanyl-D-glutamate--2,6-diaminopimelate ligase [Bauldia sp.]
MRLGDLATAGLTFAAEAGATAITGIASDSRAVGRGFLFAALPGATADGAAYVGDAVRRGAVAVLAGTGVALDLPPGVVRVTADDPRRALALVAARFHPRQPETIVAVTGTSGKTSVAAFVRQIFAAAGHEAASIGTLGIVSRRWSTYGSLTTPDSISLMASLDRLAGEGVTHAALEASSHGLDQRRLDGVRIVAAGFTNLGRDHMDYHPTVEDYLAAKLRLFTALLPAGDAAVIDMDGAHSPDVAVVAARRGDRMIRIGRAGTELKILDIAPSGFRQRVRVDAFGRVHDVLLPLAGAFQVSNALVAAGLAVGAGVDLDVALGALARLEGAPGRLELAGRRANGAMIFIDYAHKPDAIVSALSALRPMTAGRLVVVFGAGGDRDPGKRPLMGRAAAENADVVIVTDDNPRSEVPATIRAAILAAAPDAIEIADRGEAIRRAIAMLGAGDVLCIAGKGHETGQIVGSEVLPFSDHQVVGKALAAEEAA